MIKSDKDSLKLNLQFFAEPTEPTEPPAEPPKEPTEPTEPTESKLELTEEELQKKIESESDRKLNSALKKEREKMREEMKKEVEAQRKEAERLAKLSQKEREEAESKKRQEELDKREQELNQRELKSDAISVLSEKGFPSEFNEFLANKFLGNNSEETLENINTFKEMNDKMLNQQVKEALRQETPESGAGTISGNDKKSKREMAKKARII